MGRFDRIARGMRPKSLIDYARLEEPDFSPSGSEIVAESFENAVKTASEALLQGKRDQMQFQLQMEDRNLKRKQVIAQADLARRQVENAEDSATSSLFESADPSDNDTLVQIISTLKNPKTQEIYTDYHERTVKPTVIERDRIENIVSGKSISEILKMQPLERTDKEGNKLPPITGNEILDDYSSLLSKETGLIPVKFDASLKLKIAEYNKARGLYDFLASEGAAGILGINQDTVDLIASVSNSTEVRKLLTDNVETQNPGTFNNESSKSLYTKIASEIGREQNNVKINVQRISALIAEKTKKASDVARRAEIDRDISLLEGENKKIQIRINTLSSKITQNKPTLLTGEETETETVAERKAREALEKIAAKKEEEKAKKLAEKQTAADKATREAEETRKKAEALVNKAVEEPLTDTTTQRSKYSNRSLTSPRDLPLTTTTQDTTVEDEVVSEDVVETETTKTVLDTVAMETMNAIEKRNPFVKNYKPKDITKDQLLRIAKSGELTNEQLNAVADFLTANAGKVIKPAKNNRDLRELISIIFSK